MEKYLEQIKHHYDKKESNNFYREVKKSRQNMTIGTNYCWDEGQLLGDTKDKLDRWTRYFKQLLNGDKKAIQQEEQEDNEDQND